MKKIIRFLYERLTKQGKRERSGRYLKDLMAEGEPGWGWKATNAHRLLAYVSLQGAVKAPLDKIPLRVIEKATKKYNLAFVLEDGYAWVGHDTTFILRKIRESNRSERAV